MGLRGGNTFNKSICTRGPVIAIIVCHLLISFLLSKYANAWSALSFSLALYYCTPAAPHMSFLNDYLHVFLDPRSM